MLKELAVNAAPDVVLRTEEEELRPDVFGSAYAVMSTGVRRLRIVWDGKDGEGSIQRPVGSENRWEPIGCWLNEGDLESDPRNEQKIAEVADAVREYLAGDGAV